MTQNTTSSVKCGGVVMTPAFMVTNGENMGSDSGKKASNSADLGEEVEYSKLAYCAPFVNNRLKGEGGVWSEGLGEHHQGLKKALEALTP